MTSGWDRARAVADAVLYEGYLLYPYRGTSSKNQSRWQFGVLGPPGAAEAGLGEDDTLAAEFLVDGSHALTLMVRFLQLQHRGTEREFAHGAFEPVDELTTATGSWLTWDEAVECELSFGPLTLDGRPRTLPVALRRMKIFPSPVRFSVRSPKETSLPETRSVSASGRPLTLCRRAPVRSCCWSVNRESARPDCCKS